MSTKGRSQVKKNKLRAFALICLLVLLVQLVPAAAFADAPYPWLDTTKTPEERARALLDASTLDQKIRWLDEQAANNPTQTTFSGVTYPVQVPGTPMIQYTDGPNAVVGAGSGVTVFPAQVGLAATWDLALAREKGAAYAWEAFYKQRNVTLAPGLYSARTPQSGRNNEYFGEDPLLAGLMAAANIRGIQEDTPPDVKVQAQLKHYLANEQEVNRQTSSSNMDERTLYETYVLPWEIAIKEGKPGSVMCSFNQVNHVWACESGAILNEALKTYIGFTGWVVTDFGSQHSTAASLINGLDQELNRPRWYTPALLHAALDAGQITEAQIDAAAFRVVANHIKYGLFDVTRPTTALANVSSPEHRAIARREVEEGAVLLKNANGILPLTGSGKTIAVIGQTAAITATGGISAGSVCGPTQPSVACTPVAPLDAITARAAQSGNTVVYNNGSDTAAAAAVAAGANVAIVFGYYRAGEGSDKATLSLDGNGNALISAVAAANPNTVVILQTGGPVLMPWVNEVKAVFEVWYAGVEMGTAIAELLWGDVNPSGKLPQTFPVNLTDLPASTPRQYPGIIEPEYGTIRQVYYDEGIYVGYKWFDAQNIQPLFPFGHGLSYTTFRYDGLGLTSVAIQPNRPFNVHFRVTNTGAVAGTEIAQVYLSLPAAANEPPQRLIGWERVTLQPGEHKLITLTINPNSSAHPMSYWDVNTDKWVMPSGVFGIKVGSSSRDLPLSAKLMVRAGR